MDTRLHKIIGDVLTRKTRTALIALSIGIGVLGVIVLTTMGMSMLQALQDSIHEDKLGMVRSDAILNAPAPVDDASYLELIRALPDVTAAQGMGIYPAYWQLDGEFVSARLFTYSEPYGEIPLETPTLHTGRYPVTGQQELAVERRFLEEHNLQLGDTLTLRILSDGTEETWTIVGTIFQPYQYKAVPGAPTSILAKTMLFATYEDARRIAGAKGFNLFVLRGSDFAQAKDIATAFETLLTQQTPYVPVYTVTEDPAKNLTIESVKGISGLMSTLGMVSLVISGFLVYNVISALVIEQRRQIGVLKSLGATMLDITLVYGGIGLIYGLMGVIPGVILAVPLGDFMTKNVIQQIDTISILIEGFSYSPAAISMGVMMGLVIPVLAAVVPVLTSGRVTIREAMTDLGISSTYQAGMVVRLLDWLPMSLRQAFRSLFLKKSRVALSVITLCMSAGAYMGIYTATDSLNSLIENVYATIGNSITITPTTTTADYDQLAAQIEAEVEGVTAVSSGAALALEIEGYTPKALGINAAAVTGLGVNPAVPNLVNYDLVSGEGWTRDPQQTGVVVTETIADVMGLAAGDTINVRAGGQWRNFEVLGVAKFPADMVWFHWQDLATLGNLTNESGDPRPNNLLVMLDDPDPSVEAIDEKIEEINEVLLASGVSANYTNWGAMQATVTENVNIAISTLNGASMLIGLVGAIGLLSMLSISVYERQKEIGVMRSVGASSSKVALQFLSEGLLVGAVAWLVGVPLSNFFNVGIMEALNFGDEANRGFLMSALVTGLAGMFILTAAASLFPSLSAARKTVSDILRYQ